MSRPVLCDRAGMTCHARIVTTGETTGDGAAGNGITDDDIEAVYRRMRMTGHWVGQLAVGLVDHGDRVEGVAPMRQVLCAPGTDRVRTGTIATMVDLIAGHVPNGAHGPTVDLRVELVAAPPVGSRLRLVARPLRIGKRLIVGDTALQTTDGLVVGRATTTFINNELPFSYRETNPEVLDFGAASPDEFIGAVRLGDGRVELPLTDRIANGAQGTIQGGVQALLAEIAADHALVDGIGAPERRSTAIDLDIRYLGRLPVGPMAATATVLTADDAGGRVTVRLTDAGNGHSLVSFVSLSMRFCDRPFN